MAQYTQRTHPMHRPGQTDHGHGGGGALAYGGSGGGAGGVVAPPQPRAPPAAPYAPQPYPPAQLRLHQPGYGSAALSYRDGSYGRGGGAVVGGGGAGGGEYRGGGGNARLSLLGSYAAPPAPPAHHPPPADPPPFKKIRLAAERPHHHNRIDNREQMNSYATVEVLSPPSEPSAADDHAFRTTKDELLQQISKVDREMALSEATLSKLKKKQAELQQAASRPLAPAEPEEAPVRHRSLAHSVYADNRRRAALAHAALPALAPPARLPLYNQPADAPMHAERLARHHALRPQLARHVLRLRRAAERREDQLAADYCRRAAEWARRVERLEQGPKRRARDAKNRDFFEKVFPELRKAREERERFHRLGARVKSEAELEELADTLHEQEHDDKKMRALTVVPPLRLHPSATHSYLDTNRRCLDMEEVAQQQALRGSWSPNERSVFRDKYLQHPKNFATIASFLPRKSVADCVRFYYLSKKRENYKQLLRKPRQRRSGRGPARGVAEPDAPGVTTRLQRSQGHTRDKDTGDALAPARVELCPSSPPPLPTSPAPACSAPPPGDTAVFITSSVANSSSPPPLPASPAPTPVPTPTQRRTPTPTPTPSLAPAASPAAPAASPAAPATSPAPPASPAPQPPQPAPVSQPAPPAPVSQPVTISSQPTVLTQSPLPPLPQPQPADNAVVERISPVTCVTISPVVSGAGASSAGASAAAGAPCAACLDPARRRFNDNCHCRGMRSRYSRCPVPTCEAGARAKRLRYLPPRWHELTPNDKRPLLDEFQVPSELSKCCVSCVKRISRRLFSEGEAPEPSAEEAASFASLLRQHGRAWVAMAAVARRPPAALKAFYFTHRRRLQLHAVADKPTRDRDDSETEEGSSYSGMSCSESPPPAAAAAPPPPPPPRPPRRDEYDSSATETADEDTDCAKQSAPRAPQPPSPPLPPAPVTPALSPAPPPPVPVAAAPAQVPAPAPRNGPAPPLTVRDVVLNMIEISLMKSSQPTPPQPKPPAPREPLATLSVVAAPSPRGPPPAPPADEPVLLVHMEPRELLDLSVKRPRPERQYAPPARDQHFRRALKPANKGSITLGTPVEHKSGSITAGTPQYKRRSPYATPYRAQFADQRQLIMADFITSQQMHGTARRGRAASPAPAPAAGYAAAAPAPGYPPPAPASVIQRHPHPPPPPPPPGHEAFTSLVDVASAATALPVPTEHKHHHHHDMRMQERMQRDIAIAQKYHQQIQYQVLERDRQAQRAQYIERDRQIAMQQNRDRERALAAMADRQHVLEQQHQQHQHQQHQQQQHQQQQHQQQQHQQQQHQQQQHQQQQQQHQQQQHQQQQHQQQQHQQQQHQQQQLQQHQQQLHDRHLIHQTMVSSQDGERRLLAPATYSVAKHRPPPPPTETKQPSPHPSSQHAVPQHPVPQLPGPQHPAAAHAARAEGTLTAASLIDAIITHQISQTDHTRYPSTLIREPGDPAPAPPLPPGPPGAPGGPAAGAGAPAEEGASPPPPLHTTSIKLGDLASNIITRDFCSPTTSMLHHNSGGGRFAGAGGGGDGGGNAGGVAGVGAGGGVADDWKRRDAPKHAPYLEPVSPPDTHNTSRPPSSTPAGGKPRYSGSGVSGVLTAFDYVTNRIVEVMRSDDKLALTPYAYPYSALNVPDTERHKHPSPPAAPPAVPPAAPEPAPLMSAQYEPLSDED